MSKFLTRHVYNFFIDAELQAIMQPTTATANGGGRKAPNCRKCGEPRKGHKRGQCCSTEAAS